MPGRKSLAPPSPDDSGLERSAKELKLTQKELKFCEYYIFITGLDDVKAVEMAGYSAGDYSQYTPDLADYYKRLYFKSVARDILSRPKVQKFLRELRDNLEDNLIVDKLWVINKLKTLAENSSDSVQLQATKLIGQHLGMFEETQKVELTTDPGQIAREAFKKRMEEEKNKGKVIEFPKQEEQNA